ncbi:hypothetical protein KEC46_33045 [Nocardia seriolae]|nr:hypothetical protein KEC46_33045 [Nocardia seriolae]
MPGKGIAHVGAATVLPLSAHVAAAVTAAIGRARPQLAGSDPVVRRSDRADFQSNAALPLAKRIAVPPARLAAELAADLEPDAVIAHVGASGPGFLNITVTDTASWAQLAARLADPRLGVGEPAHGSASSSTTPHPTWPRKCTSAICAPRSSATAWPGCSPSSAPTWCAPITSATGAPSSGC